MIQVEDHQISLGGNQLFGRSIRVRPQGTAPTLVFLHDALGSVDSWRGFPQRLCEQTNFNGFLFDRLGHGRSDAYEEERPNDYLEREAEELNSILAFIGIDQPLLIGHSDGGTIALLHEARYGQSVALVSIAGHIMVEPETINGVKETAPQLLQPGQFSKLELYHGKKANKLVNDWSQVWLNEEYSRWNVCDKIGTIHCPTLVIQGMNDEYATPAHASAIVNCIGENAQAWMVSDSGHFPHKEQPELVANEITQFISSI